MLDNVGQNWPLFLLNGVRGVASSNPAAPTNEINGLALTRRQPVFTSGPSGNGVCDGASARACLPMPVAFHPTRRFAARLVLPMTRPPAR